MANVLARLLGAIVRATKAMGYRRCVSYTRPEELGASLKAVGFQLTGVTRPGDWGSSRPGRKAPDGAPKLRWLKSF